MIHTLMDVDFYKISMMQCIFHNFPLSKVEYKFICRNKDVNLKPLLPKIKKELKSLCTLKVTSSEVNFLKEQTCLNHNFLDFLEDFSFKEKNLIIQEDLNEPGQISIRIRGNWFETILFETPLLAIISQLYMEENYGKTDLYLSEKRLFEKIRYLRNLSSSMKFSDFGTRRRYSFENHDLILKCLIKELPNNFIGTSNVHFAQKYKIPVVGTMAHEYLMGGMGLSSIPLKNFQKYMLEKWIKEFRGNLAIALTDTLNMDTFLKDFDLYLSKVYDGCRHDSGCPFTWAEKLISHYEKMKIDPRTKIALFSDGLDFQTAETLNHHFQERIKPLFGIGTNLTNDLGHKPLSIVLKLVKVNGNPVAKISDQPEKAICESEDFLCNLKKTFNL